MNPHTGTHSYFAHSRPGAVLFKRPACDIPGQDAETWISGGSYSSLKAKHGTLCLDYLSKQYVPCAAPAVPAGGVPTRPTSPPCWRNRVLLWHWAGGSPGPQLVPATGSVSSSFLPCPVFPHWSKPLNHSSNQRLIRTLLYWPLYCLLLDPTHLYGKHL